jgi:hypothetical protein
MSVQSQESILLAKVIEQNNAIIALLGKMAFTKEEVLNIVVSGKQKTKKQKYVEGYNACDGNHSVSEIAKIIGVTDGTLSPILQGWEDTGIIYPVAGPRAGKFYKKIFRI